MYPRQQLFSWVNFIANGWNVLNYGNLEVGSEDLWALVQAQFWGLLYAAWRNEEQGADYFSGKCFGVNEECDKKAKPPQDIVKFSISKNTSPWFPE